MIVLRNSIFIAIPKTGSTWIREVLKKIDGRALAPMHATAERVLLLSKLSTRHADIANGKSFFAFVRHPAYWYRSIWGARCKKAAMPQSPLFGSLDACADASYEQFLRNVIRWNPGYLSRLYERFCGPKSASIHACRIEDVHYQLATILARYEHVAAATTKKIIDATPPINVTPDLPSIHVGLSNQICTLEDIAMKRFNYRPVT